MQRGEKRKQLVLIRKKKGNKMTQTLQFRLGKYPTP